MGHYFFNDTLVIDARTLQTWVGQIFEAAGMTRADADFTAETLMVADARGVYSHGCLRVPLYLLRIDEKCVDPAARPSILKERGAAAVVDGRNAAGQVVSKLAMDKAIELSTKYGISCVTARNSNHNGAVAYYSMMALPHNMIGITTSIGGGNLMSPFGAADRRIGNNPMSIAFPACHRDDIVLDMAQSVVAKGKIMMAKKVNSTIPPEWALDASGMPTTDPFKATEGFLRTMGDYKGSGLSIAIGMLSSMLADAAIGPTLKDVYEDFTPLNIGHTFLAINIDHFMDASEFKTNTDAQFDFIKNAKKAGGVEEIFLPGEMEARNYRRQMKDGITMPSEVILELVTASERFGTPIPQSVADQRSP